MSIVRRKKSLAPVSGWLKPFSKPEGINNSARGPDRIRLAAGIWTRDISQSARIAAELRAGTVWINCYNIFDSRFAVWRLQTIRLAAKWVTKCVEQIRKPRRW
jgi:acyl-CoA reductase-like NAD-dependent aldehyde dehydrogenase